jgi:dUTP pyrophosphatase
MDVILMQCEKFMKRKEETQEILSHYGKMMHLKIFVDGDDELREVYEKASKKHNENLVSNIDNIDAGFDFYAPVSVKDETVKMCKMDFQVCCSARMMYENRRYHNTGYYMHPRSSLSKTQLRLANSTGIIDSGYRGHIIAMFDILGGSYSVEKYERLAQICAPSLVPIWVEVVNSKEELGEKTVRGDGGFGSTGKGIQT